MTTTSTLTLGELQTRFQHYLLNNDESIDAFALLNVNINNQQGTNFKSDSDLKVRFQIYSDAYYFRCLSVLKKNFPKLYQLMQEDHFEKMTLAYLMQFPSHHFNLRYVGNHLPLFLKNTLPYADFDYFSEMAQFEWTLGLVSEAEEVTTPSAETFRETLKKIPIEKFGYLRVKFQPTVQILKFRWNIPTIWQKLEETKAVSLPILEEKITPWLVYREGIDPVFQSFPSEADCFVIERLLKGDSFAEVCEDLCEEGLVDEQAVPSFALACLNKCLEERLISGFEGVKS